MKSIRSYGTRGGGEFHPSGVYARYSGGTGRSRDTDIDFLTDQGNEGPGKVAGNLGTPTPGQVAQRNKERQSALERLLNDPSELEAIGPIPERILKALKAKQEVGPQVGEGKQAPPEPKAIKTELLEKLLHGADPDILMKEGGYTQGDFRRLAELYAGEPYLSNKGELYKSKKLQTFTPADWGRHVLAAYIEAGGSPGGEVKDVLTGDMKERHAMKVGGITPQILGRLADPDKVDYDNLLSEANEIPYNSNVYTVDMREDVDPFKDIMMKIRKQALAASTRIPENTHKWLDTVNKTLANAYDDAKKASIHRDTPDLNIDDPLVKIARKLYDKMPEDQKQGTFEEYAKAQYDAAQPKVPKAEGSTVKGNVTLRTVDVTPDDEKQHREKQKVYEQIFEDVDTEPPVIVEKEMYTPGPIPKLNATPIDDVPGVGIDAVLHEGAKRRDDPLGRNPITKTIDTLDLIAKTLPDELQPMRQGDVDRSLPKSTPSVILNKKSID